MATLKISELSVGDWVMCNEDKYRVMGITMFHELDLLKSSESFRTSIDNIEPILITAEILGKNGWSTDGMYAFLRIDEHRHLEYYHHEHRLRKYYCGKDEWQNHAKVTDITFSAHCYSVHQLQHALRLAGVDKEINL